MCRSSTSAIWPPTGQHGIEAGGRLLEDHRHRAAADVAHLALRSPPAYRAPRSAHCRRQCRPPSGRSRMIESAVIDFPQPDSPSSAKVSPWVIANVTSSTAAARRPARPREHGAQAVHLEQGCAHVPAPTASSSALEARRRIEGVADRIRKNVGRQHQHEHEDERRGQRPPDDRLARQLHARAL